MSNGSINRIPFGLKDGVMVQVSDVSRGLACECVCPVCHRRLQAKKGHVVSHYFSHDPSLETTSCESAFETSIHLMAKQILSEEGSAAFPSLTIKVSQSDENEATHTEEDVVEVESIKQFNEVILEKRLENIRPDIIGYGIEGPFLIEVAVTHFVDSEKKKKIRALGLPAIEIDLSSASYLITKEELKKLVVEETSKKKWLSNPKAIEIKKKIKARLDKKIKLINENIYKKRKALLEEKPFTIPFRRKKPCKAKYPASGPDSKTWFHCETCRDIFQLPLGYVTQDINTVPCPKCGHSVSTKPARYL